LQPPLLGDRAYDSAGPDAGPAGYRGTRHRLEAWKEDGFRLCQCAELRIAPIALFLLPRFLTPDAERWVLASVPSIIWVAVDRRRSARSL